MFKGIIHGLHNLPSSVIKLLKSEGIEESDYMYNSKDNGLVFKDEIKYEKVQEIMDKITILLANNNR